MQQDSLKSCPFCGGKATVTDFIDMQEEKLAYRVECDCGVIGSPAENEQEAIEAWNRRGER